MVINDVELEFDLLDVETFEKYDNFKKGLADMEDKVKDMSTVESMKYQCTAIFNAFNELFGEGTDVKIFGNRTNLGKCMDAVFALVEEEEKQANAMSNRYKKYTNARVTRAKK